MLSLRFTKSLDLGKPWVDPTDRLWINNKRRRSSTQSPLATNCSAKSIQLEICLLLGCVGPAVTPLSAQKLSLFSASERVSALSAKVFNGYARTRLPDGSFKPETYALGYGGCVSTLIIRDESIDDLTFDALTQPIKVALGGQQYVQGNDPNTTSLFVMVFWGTTYGSVNTLDGAAKDIIDAKNAALLGFDSEAGIPNADTIHYPTPFGTDFRSSFLRVVHADVISSIEVNRYFVILRAFDFQAAIRQKKLRLLWETRLSLSERHHDFGKELPQMARYASQYFGQDSHGLVRNPIPEGRVDIGEARSLGDGTEKSEAVKGPPAAKP